MNDTEEEVETEPAGDKAPPPDEPEAPARFEEPVPVRVQMNFTGATEVADLSDVEAVYDAAITEAEERGLFFEWGTVQQMEREDVIPDSPLDQVLTGKEPQDPQ